MVMRCGFTGRTGLLLSGAVLMLLAVATTARTARTEVYKPITNEAEFRQAMKDVSNWGRWGADDELGASNLITRDTRKRAAGLVKEGIAVSLAHDVLQEDAADGGTRLDRVVVNVSASGASDRYQYSGTYHGAVHSHLDALNCHVMFEGKGYNGRPMEDIKAASGCPQGSILAQKNGIFTRGVLFDATLLPGKATAQGWLEPGTAIHARDLEALEKIQRVKVAAGDVILLYTGRWKRRAALGAWKTAEGFAGYQADVAYFMKERGVSFIAHDAWNDVAPHGFPASVGLPLHRLALVALGVSIFDNLDLEEAAQVARRLKRWEFLFTASPLRIEKGMGSPVNPIATF
jgi:kynurenine formamidase